MKVNSRLIALMVAMAAGTAAAAGAGLTPAGTVISNTATAAFEDPTGPAGNTNGSVTSNAVTTTVQPKPAFDVVYSGSLDMGSDPTLSPTVPASGYNFLNKLPGDVISTPYVIVNNGNVGSNTPAGVPYNVTIANVNTSLPGGTTVAYYTDANQNGVVDGTDALITGPISVPADLIGVAGDPSNLIDEGRVNIRQVITVGPTALSGVTFSVSPSGTGNVYDSASGLSPATTEATTDLQYTQIKVTTPVITIEPPADTDPVTPGTTPPVPGTVPGTTTPNPNTYTPPTSNPGGPATTPNPGTIITVTNPTTPGATTGNQDAYPKADADTLSDVVTFVSAVKNGGSVADTMVITVGLPAGATSVTVLDKDGNVITPVGGKYTLPGGPVAPGASVPFQVVVTYPDSNGVTTPTDIVVPVSAFSGNVPSAPAFDTNTLTIHPPQMVFGDTTSGNPDPLLAPLETVTPGGANNTTTGTTADASAVFPVSIKNTGTYGDTFTLVGTVPILLTDGTTVNVPVTYYNADGSPLATAGTTLVIAPGATSNYLAVVNIPPTAAATTGNATGANPEPSLTQTATGVYSTIAKTDTNDRIKVAIVNTKPTTTTDPTTGPSNSASGIAVAKYQTKGATAPAPVAADVNTLTALPGNTIRYAIIAKNNFNTPVANFVLSDSAAANNVYTYSNLVSATATATGFLIDTTAPFTPTSVLSATVFYKVNGGAWSTTAPAAGTVITTLNVAVDTNGDSTITAADIVPANAGIRLDIAVTVK